MLKALNKKYPFSDNLKSNVSLVVGISLGVFLFLLFFQPLNPQNPDFNKKLLILATFGAITLVLLSIVRIIVPSIFPGSFNSQKWTLKKEIITDFIFLVLHSVAYVFFAKFVGKIKISFHIAIVIVLISIGAMVVLVLVNEFKYLRSELDKLKSGADEQKEPQEKTREDIKIDFASENKSEYFQLLLSEIILIKSANNYIEVFFQQDNKLQRRLIRSTLKSTEEQFSNYPEMVRCHRSCIINKNYIHKVSKSSDGLKLEIENYPEEIHVSRQYVLKVKEAIK